MADPNSHGDTPSPSLSNQSLAALTLGFIVCAVGIAAYGFIAAPGAHAMGWPSMTVALVASVFGLSGLCAFLLFRIRDLATSQVEQRRSSQIESKAPRGEDSPAGDPFADPNSDPNFRSLIENTQNGLALWLRQEDGTYALKAVNSGYCKLFGYESGTDVSVLTEIHRSGVIGTQWPWQAALNALARDGIVRNATPSGRHKNGTVIPLRATYWVVKDSDGEISGVWAFLRDRREELTVDLDRDLKNRAFEQSRVGIAIVATEGGMPSSIYYANRAHVDMNGQEAGDPFAVAVFLADRKALVDPREADAFLADITNLRRTQIRIRRENPDGGFLVQSISFSPILDDQGEATHWISFSADISEAATYAEENRTLRLAIDQIPVSISIFGPDAHSRPMFYNPKFEDLAGLTTDEIETIGNMNFADLGFMDQETLDQLNRKKASKRPSETTFAYNHPKYGDRIYRQQLAPVRNETGTIRNWICKAPWLWASCE